MCKNLIIFFKIKCWYAPVFPHLANHETGLRGPHWHSQSRSTNVPIEVPSFSQLAEDGEENGHLQLSSALLQCKACIMAHSAPNLPLKCCPSEEDTQLQQEVNDADSSHYPNDPPRLLGCSAAAAHVL